MTKEERRSKREQEEQTRMGQVVQALQQQIDAQERSRKGQKFLDAHPKTRHIG